VLPLDVTKFGVGKLKSAGFDVQFVESAKDHVFEEEEYPVIRQWVRKQLKDLGKF